MNTILISDLYIINTSDIPLNKIPIKVHPSIFNSIGTDSFVICHFKKMSNIRNTLYLYKIHPHHKDLSVFNSIGRDSFDIVTLNKCPISEILSIFIRSVLTIRIFVLARGFDLLWVSQPYRWKYHF